jgi:transposase InsO family protein
MRLVSAEGQQIAPAGFGYGYDVLVRIGWLRQEHQDTYAEIQSELTNRVQICESHVRYLYQQVYLPLLACRERQYQAHLAQADSSFNVALRKSVRAEVGLLWRSVKYEHVYLYEYETVPELEKGLREYFTFYNQERLHHSLSYQTPAEVHFADISAR